MNMRNGITTALTYSAGNDVDKSLSNSGFLTAIDLEAYVTMSGSETQLSTFAKWRIIQSLKIQGSSGTVYYNPAGTQMGVAMHLLNLRDHPGKTWRELDAAASSFKWRIQFSPRKRDIWGRENPYDLLAAIPAMDETELKLIWSCPANTALNNDTTISSAYMYVTEYRVLPVDKAHELAIKSRLMVPVSTSEGYDPGASKTNLSGERFLPTGKFLKRVSILATDATAYTSHGPLFNTDQVTAIGLYLAKENKWIINNVRAKNFALGVPFNDGYDVIDTPNTMSPWTSPGFYVLDLGDHGGDSEFGSGKDYGLDTRGMGSQDVKLGMTIDYASGEKEQIFCEMFEPHAEFVKAVGGRR